MTKKKIISQNFYKIYTEKKNSLFLFMVYEFLDKNESGIIYKLEEERSFNNWIIYNKEIIEN